MTDESVRVERIGGPVAVREARVRPESAPRYSWMQPQKWYIAATVVSAVRHGEAGLVGEARPLPDEHFEFRGGGEQERPPGTRTRSTDRRTTVVEDNEP